MPPDPDAYRQAIIAARGIIQQVDEEAARRLIAALRAFADGLEGRLVSDFSDWGPDRLGGPDARDRTASIVLAQAEQMESALREAVAEGRTMAYEDVLGVWRAAGVEAASAVGVDMATLGRVRGAPVNLMGVFESFNAPANWRTLLRGHVEDAASEANRVMVQGFAEGIGPQEMSRRMRRYVVGSEQFDELFEDVPTLSGEVAKLDLRKVPADMRGAARQVEFNARRIAFTEFQQARGEAETQHFLRDPMVEAVQRELAPNRSTSSWSGPDECDVLVSQDAYGMGPGTYPIGKAPALAVHPFDRCSHRTIARLPSEMGEPKPTPDRRVHDTAALDIPGGGDLTEAQARRAREAAMEALEGGERAWQEIQRRAA